MCLSLCCLRMKNVVGGVLHLSRAEGEPRCWSVFTASVERKGGRARADDLEGVQNQGPCLGDLHSSPQGDTATAYLFLHFYFFFILFHSTAFISLSSQFRRTSTPALFPTSANHCVICWRAFFWEWKRSFLLLLRQIFEPGWIINLSCWSTLGLLCL